MTISNIIEAILEAVRQRRALKPIRYIGARILHWLKEFRHRGALGFARYIMASMIYWLRELVGGKIDYHSSAYVDKQFRLNPEHCRDSWTVDRNKALLKFIDGVKFDNVFEFAGASGLLAEMFLTAHTEINSYVLSDYSPVVCRIARRHLKCFDNVSVRLYDMTKDMDNIPWNDFDLVISTSMEHLPKGVDIDILQHIRKGTHILWSLSTFDACTHLHPYPNKEYVIERFRDFIDMKVVTPYDNVILLHGRKLQKS